MIRGAAGLGYDDNQSMARFNGLRLSYTSFNTGRFNLAGNGPSIILSGSFTLKRSRQLRQGTTSRAQRGISLSIELTARRDYGVGRRRIWPWRSGSAVARYPILMKYSVHSRIFPSFTRKTATTCEVRVFSGVTK
jgi:hypothetical protein